MRELIATYIPKEFATFILVTLFSLLIGLSIRKMSMKREGPNMLFGTDRTFTFIGIWGYILYILDPNNLFLFMGGGVILGVLFSVYYYVKQNAFHTFGLTTIIMALITYSLGPIVATQPSWFYLLIIVTVLLFSELKSTFTEVAERMQNDELITLAKFLLISGIILPMLPDTNIIPDINLTPYTIWFATVVVSGISYLSYLLKRYVFKNSGIIILGIIGGLYSSTATISVLARKSKTDTNTHPCEYVSAMLMAVAVMFIRFLILIYIFSKDIFNVIFPYLIILSVTTFIVAIFIKSKYKLKALDDAQLSEEESESNPLEFKVAVIFATLFVVFTFATHLTLEYMGASGLNVLSFIAGLSDITPFILNLLQSSAKVEMIVIVACIMQSMMSNIIVNMCYAFFFSGRGSNKVLSKWIFRGFSMVIVVNAITLASFYLLSSYH